MLTKVTDLIFTKAYAADANLNFLNLFKFKDNTAAASADTFFTTVVTRSMVWVLGIIMLIAFIYLIMSGVKYITAGGDAAKATEARTGILNAIIGVVVILLAFVILRFAGGLAGKIGG